MSTKFVALAFGIIIGLSACTFSFQGEINGNNPDLLTYTNDKYGYTFNYPRSATISEVDKNAFNVTPEEYRNGITVDSLLAQYTGKICVRASLNNGYMAVAAAANNKPNGDIVALCMRTGVGACSPESQRQGGNVSNYDKDVTIGGKIYTAHGTRQECTGDEPPYVESLRVKLEDGTKIEFGGSAQSKEAYDALRTDLVKMVESYKKI